jgi:glycerophosphoryl diester phosphodiesterase
VQQRLPSLYPKPILFAHRGASAHTSENTIDAFSLALKLGATGLETDCWVTKDLHVVLDHDGFVKRRNPLHFRKKRISDVYASDLNDLIPRFDDLLQISSPITPLSVDVCDPSAMPLIDKLVSEIDSKQDIYICHPDIELLINWKKQYPSFKYVNSIRLSKIFEGPERRCANLAQNGIDALNMHHTDWNGGLVALAHRFKLAAFSWDLQHTEQLVTALLMGADAVYSDWPDRMCDASRQVIETA